MNIFKNNKLLLQGKRNKMDSLWDVPLTPTIKNHEHYINSIVYTNEEHTINVMVHKKKSKLELAQYLHACAGSPVISTFQKVISNGNFITWPGIEKDNFKSLLKTTLATAKCYLDKERKNLQSTKQPTEINIDNFPDKDKKAYERISCIIQFSEKETSYIDLKGKFPHKSPRGNQYLLLLHDFDENTILMEPFQSRIVSAIVKAWTKLNSI